MMFRDELPARFSVLEKDGSARKLEKRPSADVDCVRIGTRGAILWLRFRNLAILFEFSGAVPKW